MKIWVNRKAHFNAAHRLYNPAWDEDKNADVFGKCSNPYYHGHNYELIVGVRGELDKETGFVVDMKWLKDLIFREIEERFDHKNLNEECVEFKEINPTAENIALVIWQILRKNIKPEYDLKVRLYETPRNFVDVEN